ncbi:hypothetical protein [Endozoicomonas acroporae]|uniref:hypothetical protein n=1 Tax=Endozoicomonas acroporae TaxID=1701104 RepID=UPI003D7B7139
MMKTIKVFLIDKTGIQPVELQLKNDDGLSHIRELIQAPLDADIKTMPPLPTGETVLHADAQADFGFLCNGNAGEGAAIVAGYDPFTGELKDAQISLEQLAKLVMISV